jgi:hypothetical protein
MSIRALRAIIRPYLGLGHVAIITDWVGEQRVRAAFAVTDERIVHTDDGVFKCEEVFFVPEGWSGDRAAAVG